ncbi:MAG: STAS domain-containing protein [Betaproteobacteria bacterium]|nr:STAS domain-containing protein [Betaproteobacteria bacterium]MDH3436979.1 STAS domain-containing protein [Betaproteobacteria bacterium]
MPQNKALGRDLPRGHERTPLTTAPDPGMNISDRRISNAVVLEVTGRIDNDTCEAFRLRLAPFLRECTGGGDRLVLDFTGVDYISSVGLRVLMLAAKQAKKQGGTVVLAGLHSVVKEIFEISRFDLVFQCFTSVRDALAAAAPRALAASERA